MNFDELQKTWGRQSVAGPRLEPAPLRAQLAREARQRSRRVLRIIGVATGVFVTGWAVGLAAHVAGIRPFNPVTLTTFIAASLFDLGCLVVAVRALRRMRREALGLGETLADALQASRRALERQMRDCRLFGYGLAAGAAGHAALTLVHFFTGNLPRLGVVLNVALTLGFAAGIALTLRRYYRDQLVPRRAALDRELGDLQG